MCIFLNFRKYIWLIRKSSRATKFLLYQFFFGHDSYSHLPHCVLTSQVVFYISFKYMKKKGMKQTMEKGVRIRSKEYHKINCIMHNILHHISLTTQHTEMWCKARCFPLFFIFIAWLHQTLKSFLFCFFVIIVPRISDETKPQSSWNFGIIDRFKPTEVDFN